MAARIFPGDIIIVNNWHKNFLSKAIRFFTKSWSHTAFGFFDLVGAVPSYDSREPKRVQTIFEANLTTGVTQWSSTFDNLDYDVRIYRWNMTITMDKIMWELFDSFNGNTYGYSQLLWFVWRWLVEKLALPTRWARKNFFPNNEICTEVIYVGLKKMNDPEVNAVLATLDKDQNTVHPGDIIWICNELCKKGKMVMVYNRERQ